MEKQKSGIGGFYVNYTVHTPEGTRDRLFAECRERRQVQQALTALFRRRSYAEIITPEVEFYDLFLQSGNPLPQEAMLKIIDRSGKIMVMRPDCTTPIARVAATKLRTVPLPQRLYYDQTVFRSGQEHRGGSSEIAQCGVELIGAGGKKADLEMVALAVDALKAAGLEQFHVELGHVGFFRELTARVDALFRRISGDGMAFQDLLRQGPFVMDTRNHTLEKAGNRVRLTQVEYAIMKLFMQNPGRALSREDILRSVWGRDYEGDLKIVDVNIRRLRIKIEDDATNPTYITTVWGFGYKWGA